MSHEVVKMFSVREAPWHINETQDRTTVLDEYPGREEAMKLAGHDFTVEEEPQYRRIVRVVDGVETVSFVKVDGYKFLVNSQSKDNNKVLHSARDSYVVVQPEVLYDLTEAILDADDDVKWETGGVLRDGAVLWTLARVDKPFFVTGDDSPIFPFVAASTTNDGTGGVKVSNIQTRIVCMNTFGAADSEAARSGREFSFRHTKNVNARIEEAKAVLAGATEQVNRFRELGEELVKVTFTDKAIEQFITEFIPMPTETLVSERVKNNVEEARATVRATFHSQTVPDAVRNTGYGALNVGIEYLQHLRRWRNDATYLNRTLLQPEALGDRLVPMIRRIAEENPLVTV